MYKRILYVPGSNVPFRLSRSKIDLFVECPRCFYLDRRCGVSRPSMPGFSLNSAVDTLLKKEFDILRKEKRPHALMKTFGIKDFVPFSHPDLDIWRNNFKGKDFLHKPTNLVVFGAVDDVWIDAKGTLYLVDYKSTSTNTTITLDGIYKQGYKRQMEVYQWLFRRGGFTVSDTGYFVFANAGKDRQQFDARLEFALTIIPHKGDDSWIESTLGVIKTCLESDSLPECSQRCEHCRFVEGYESAVIKGSPVTSEQQSLL